MHGLLRKKQGWWTTARRRSISSKLRSQTWAITSPRSQPTATASIVPLHARWNLLASRLRRRCVCHPRRGATSQPHTHGNSHQEACFVQDAVQQLRDVVADYLRSHGDDYAMWLEFEPSDNAEADPAGALSPLFASERCVCGRVDG